MTPAQAHRATAIREQHRRAIADQRAAKRDLGVARRRLQEAARIRSLLEAEAAELGLELLIHRHSPGGTVE